MDTVDCVAYKRQKFLTVPEAGKFKIKVPAHLVSSEHLLPGSQTTVFSLCPHTGEGMREFSQALFIRALIPLTRVPPS